MSSLSGGDATHFQESVQWIARQSSNPPRETEDSSLTDLHATLARRHTSGELYCIANHLYSNAESVARKLHSEGQVLVDPGQLRSAALILANQTYRHELAEVLGFIEVPAPEAPSGVVKIALDEVYGERRVRQGEIPPAEPFEEKRITALLNSVEPGKRHEDIQQLERFEQFGFKWGQRCPLPKPFPRAVALARLSAHWIVGPPGSGKTTLLRWFARHCALGTKCGMVPNPVPPAKFPILFDLSEFVAVPSHSSWAKFLESRLIELGGEALHATFQENFRRGNVVYICDDASDTPPVTDRIALIKHLDAGVNELQGNRLLFATRPEAQGKFTSFSRDSFLQITELDHWAFAELMHRRHEAEIQNLPPNAATATTFTQPLDAIYDVRGNPFFFLVPRFAALLPGFCRHLRRTPLNRAELLLFELGYVPDQPHLREFAAALDASKSCADPIPALIRECQNPIFTHLVPLVVGAWSLDPSRQKYATDFLSELRANASSPTPQSTLLLKVLVECLGECVSAPTPEIDQALLLVAKALHETSDFQTRVELCEALRLCPAMPGPDSIQAWIPLANHENWQVRLEAMRLLSRLSKDDILSNGLHTLFTQSLEADFDLDVKAWASFGLWRHDLESNPLVLKWISHGIHSRTARIHLSASLESKFLAFALTQSVSADRLSREHATLALKLFPNNPDALHALLSLAEDPSPQLNIAALNSIASWKCHPEFFPALRRLLASPHRNVRASVLRIVRSWINHPEAEQLLLAALEDTDLYIQHLVSKQLFWWQPKPSQLPEIARLLDHRLPSARGFAVHILHASPPSAEILEIITVRLSAPDPTARLQAVSLFQGWGKSPLAWATLLGLLKDPNPEILEEACTLLGQFPQTEQSLGLLLGFLDHPVVAIRRIATEAVGNWPPSESIKIPLFRRLEDDFSIVRAKALGVIAKWEPMKEVLPRILELLGDDYPVVRDSAAGTLEAWGMQAEALETLRHHQSHPKADIRAHADFTLERWAKLDTQ